MRFDDSDLNDDLARYARVGDVGHDHAVHYIKLGDSFWRILSFGDMIASSARAAFSDADQAKDLSEQADRLYRKGTESARLIKIAIDLYEGLFRANRENRAESYFRCASYYANKFLDAKPRRQLLAMRLEGLSAFDLSADCFSDEVARMMLEYYQKARYYYKQATEKNPDCPHYYEDFGSFLVQTARFDESDEIAATDCFTHALNLRVNSLATEHKDSNDAVNRLLRELVVICILWRGLWPSLENSMTTLRQLARYRDTEGAKLLYPDAHCLLGLMACYSITHKDTKAAFAYFSAATQYSDTVPEATCMLGVCYHLGLGVDKDLVQAERLMNQAAAKSDIIKKELAIIHFHDALTPSDTEVASSKLFELAKQGDLIAGHDLISRISVASASPDQLRHYFFWMSIAHALSPYDATVTCDLAEYYFRGWGVRKNYAHAKKLIDQAIEHGNVHAHYLKGK